MSNPVDDIVNVFGTLKKLATGETTVDEIGEEVFGGSSEEALEVCPNGGCALAAGHVPPCRPVRPAT